MKYFLCKTNTFFLKLKIHFDKYKSYSSSRLDFCYTNDKSFFFYVAIYYSNNFHLPVLIVLIFTQKNISNYNVYKLSVMKLIYNLVSWMEDSN